MSLRVGSGLLAVVLIAGGCQTGGSVQNRPAPASMSSDLEFFDALNQTPAVSRQALLRGMLLAKTGEATASFAENAQRASEAGLGDWSSPQMSVSVGEASAVAVLAVNGESIAPASAMERAAAAGLVRADRGAATTLSGPDLLALLDGVQGMIERGETIGAAAAPMPPAPTMTRNESFEEFGASEPARPAPIDLEPAPPPASPPPPAPVPTVRPEPLPDLPPTAPPASEQPPAPKPNPWMPGTPVPQKPR
ncbi:MAG: hypothetical protein AB7K52_09060 [Phycisphaerales bacterium]